jgi:hypothetical protein
MIYDMLKKKMLMKKNKLTAAMDHQAKQQDRHLRAKLIQPQDLCYKMARTRCRKFILLSTSNLGRVAPTLVLLAPCDSL